MRKYEKPRCASCFCFSSLFRFFFTLLRVAVLFLFFFRLCFDSTGHIKKCFLSFLLHNNCNKVKRLSKHLNPCLRLLFLFRARIFSLLLPPLFENNFFSFVRFDNNFSSAALNALRSTRWISAYSPHDPTVIIDCRCNDADVVISHDFFSSPLSRYCAWLERFSHFVLLPFFPSVEKMITKMYKNRRAKGATI